MDSSSDKKLGEAQARLVAALRDAKCPQAMIDLALDGYYDDYKSDQPCPIILLVNDLQDLGLHYLAEQAMNGAFDGTQEDASAWRRGNEAKGLFGLLGKK